MSRQWSSEDIHFMQEPPGDIDGEAMIFVNRPYLSVHLGEADNMSSESSTIGGRIHRYPRILSLGLMLIEIGTGQPARLLFQNSKATINSDWLSAREFLSKANPWVDFDYGNYWDAARSCVNNPLFRPLSADVEGRRRIVLEDIVIPLEDLLTGTGWMRDLWTVEPTKSLSTR